MEVLMRFGHLFEIDKKAPQLRCDAIPFLFAERPRFELGIPFWSIHAFQACLLSHSSISPWAFPKNRDCKDKNFFRNHKKFVL